MVCSQKAEIQGFRNFYRYVIVYCKKIILKDFGIICFEGEQVFLMKNSLLKILKGEIFMRKSLISGY